MFLVIPTAIPSSIFPEIRTSEYNFCLQYEAYDLTSSKVIPEIAANFFYGRFPEPSRKLESKES